MDLRNRVARGEDLSGLCLIDAHGHMGSHRNSPQFGEPGAAGLVAFMDQIGMEKCLCSALLAVCNDFSIGNDEIHEAMQAFPGRFMGLCVVDPNYPEDIESELALRMAQGFSGVKIHPFNHHCYVTDPSYHILYKYAHKHGLVIKSHTYCDGSYSNVVNEPALFDELAHTYKNATFIIGHAGGAPWGFQQTIEVARKHDNVYVELASTLGFTSHWLKKIVDGIGDEKILFGSDMPLYDPRAAIGVVLYAKIPDRSKERILGLNAKRIFEPKKLPR
jgi:uncharacterized protein